MDIDIFDEAYRLKQHIYELEDELATKEKLNYEGCHYATFNILSEIMDPVQLMETYKAKLLLKIAQLKDEFENL